MKKLYESATALSLLLIGWILVSGSMLFRMVNGLDIPMVNWFFLIVGVAVYFLPLRYAEREQGEALRLRLLWLLVAAGGIIFAWEVLRVVFFGARG